MRNGNILQWMRRKADLNDKDEIHITPNMIWDLSLVSKRRVRVQQCIWWLTENSATLENDVPEWKSYASKRVKLYGKV